jgi:hypothetical protein
MIRDFAHNIVCLVVLVCSLMVADVFGQETVSVIAIKANVRGTPSNNGKIVTTVTKNSTYELLKEKAPWYLIQTDDYAGWIHGNSISLESVDFTALDKYIDDITKPKTTSKPITGGDSPFQSEYMGGETTTIRVFNQTDRLLTLKFGGVTYSVKGGEDRLFEVDGGRYEYFASVPRAYPISGVKEFGKGYVFSWRFYIVRR